MGRRHFFHSSALVSTGALLGCATPGVAQQKPKTPFDLPQIYIPVVGSDEMFPVRRIYCIGRNYAAHAREMGSDPTREPPFFLSKTNGRHSVCCGWHHGKPPLSAIDKKLSLRGRVGGGFGQGWAQHSGR